MTTQQEIPNTTEMMAEDAIKISELISKIVAEETGGNAVLTAAVLGRVVRAHVPDLAEAQRLIAMAHNPGDYLHATTTTHVRSA